MGMTLAVMRKALRGIIGEPAEDRFPNDDSATLGIGVDLWLNMGLKAFFADSKWATSRWKIAVTGSDTYSESNRIYSLPSDCLEIDRDDMTFNALQIEAITRKELHTLDEDYEESDASTVKWIEEVGTPTHFYMEKEDVYGLYPTPNTNANGKYLRFSGIEAPDALSVDSSEAPLPYDLCMGIVHWAAWNVFMSDNDSTKAGLQLQMYNRYVGKATDRKRTRERRKPLKMRTNKQYYIDPDSWITKND